MTITLVIMMIITIIIVEIIAIIIIVIIFIISSGNKENIGAVLRTFTGCSLIKKVGVVGGSRCMYVYKREYARARTLLTVDVKEQVRASQPAAFLLFLFVCVFQRFY